MQLFALNCSSARLHMMLAIIKILTSERFNTPLVASKQAQIPQGFMPTTIKKYNPIFVFIIFWEIYSEVKLFSN